MAVIRLEHKNDFKNVENLAREAFWNLYFPGCHEHFVIHKMRHHDDCIKELSLVIEVDGQAVGAIFYTHSKVILNGGGELKTITFGPVFICPTMHRKGLGKALINHSISKAKEMGYKGILTLGYPYHYSPYGFVGAKNYNISMSDGKFYKGLLALPLQDNALDNISGFAEFSQIFEVDPQEVEQYDQANFTPKPKLVTPSQAEFTKACAELDE